MPLFMLIFPNTGSIAPNRLLHSRRPALLSIFCLHFITKANRARVTFIDKLHLSPCFSGAFRIHCFRKGHTLQSFKYPVKRV